MPIAINGSGTITGASTLATTVVSPTFTTATLTTATLTTPNINSAQFATVTGTAPIYPCRAWVNFDGTNAFSPNPSTTAIRASGNVSSITDNGTGDYTVNFTTAMPDANYGFFGTCGRNTSSSDSIVNENVSVVPTTTAVRFGTTTGAGSLTDMSYVNVAIFR
jgi:hypothetical protein